jgi:hypothetical protein
MTADLRIPTDDHSLTVALFVDALTVVANSVGIVASGLASRGMAADDAEDEAVSRTVSYFKTDAQVVRAARRALCVKLPCDLHTLASECHLRRTPEIFALGREWLTHRGKPNMLVRPFVH